MSKNNGGPAFPTLAVIGDMSASEGGMTLRDYFAAKAMQALITCAMADGTKFDKTAPEVFAFVGYEVADAMLAEREACAKACNDIDTGNWDYLEGASLCAAAIRARK